MPAPDGDLVGVALFDSIAQIIDEEIDPNRVKLIYGWTGWNDRSEMDASCRAVMKRREILGPGMALAIFFMERGVIRQRRHHTFPRAIADHNAKPGNCLISFERHRIAIRKAEEDDRSKGIFPFGHDKPVPGS